jgi:hypothetical protein
MLAVVISVVVAGRIVSMTGRYWYFLVLGPIPGARPRERRKNQVRLLTLITDNLGVRRCGADGVEQAGTEQWLTRVVILPVLAFMLAVVISVVVAGRIVSMTGSPLWG